MSNLRTIVVALVALAIAAFPLAGASAQGVSSEPAHVSSQADCEKHAQIDRGAGHQMMGHQVKSHQANADLGKGHCGKAGGCGGKCFCVGLTAVLMPAQSVAPSAMFIVKTARATDAIVSPAYIPPSPPPRV
jgi:hypothetical protein